MPFKTALSLAYSGGGEYVLTAPLVYEGATDTIEVPTGFVTDLASVPRLFWALLPPHGAYERSAVLHDYGCAELSSARRLGIPASLLRVSPRDVDGLFRRCCREAGVSLPARWVLWWGVRLGALANPARRAGIWRDLPVMAAVGAVVLAAATASLLGLGWVVQAVMGW